MFKRSVWMTAFALFALLSVPIYADWDPEDGHKMHYPQLPDEEGWNVNATYPIVLADDWMCSESGPVDEIHFWGSWREGLTGGIDGFTIRIFSDIPVDPPQIEYSRPGTLLWENYFAWPDVVARLIVPDPPLAEGWYDPMTDIWNYPDHYEYWQYNIINILEPFIQEEGTIYWLSVTAHVTQSPDNHYWGWKSTLDHWNDDAVVGEDMIFDWVELYEPQVGYDYIPGDVGGSGSVTILDYTYLSNFLYQGGPAPPLAISYPPYYPAADVNGDCVVDAADLTYLQDYLNGIGPAPSYCPNTPPLSELGDPVSLDLSFVINASEEELGACCYQDGSCANLSLANCTASGGTWQGAGTICLGDGNMNGIDDACEGVTPTGACCYPDGSCVVIDQATCTSAGGTWQGAGTTCSGDLNGNLIDDACEGAYPTGACCFPDGSCITTSSGACALAGGTYKGDGTVCLGDGDMNGIDDACEEEPIEPCDYYKAPYGDYAPNGMPDFDQKQGTWFYGQPPSSQWSHCGPVALANCLWWFDSKYEPSPVDPRPFYPGPGNPPTNDNYPLLQSFEPTGGLWDDHDTNNVVPFIDSLAVLAQTNVSGSGTTIWDLANAAATWVSVQGLDPKYIIDVYAMDDVEADYEFIRHEIMSSEDVILLLGFWEEIEPGFCERIGGHYVTCAGVCTAPPESALCISDPYYDANEGEPPAGSAHGPTVHNDTWYVSGPHGTIDHDKYYVAPLSGCSWLQPPYFALELPGYPTTPTLLAQFAGQNLYDPSMTPVPPMGGVVHTVIEYALVICPDHDEDGVHDGVDNCPGVYNPSQTNSDGDSHGDACDNCPTTDNEDQADADSDTVGDVCDNCPTISNTSQTNSDSDTHGDVCDNCPTTDNEDQADGDTDTVGDVCDNCPTTPNTSQTNSDSDTHGDACDNCPTVDNETQTDTDSDGQGDACDPDDDNDGVLDGSDYDSLDPDVCEDSDSDGCDDCAVGDDDFGPNPDNYPNNDGLDTDGDGYCDAGDPDDDNDGVPDVVDTDSTDPDICQDLDSDGCDDCAIGTDDFGPLPDFNPANDGTDTDSDGICDLTDNCIDVYNPLQEDSDSDGIGDSCEVGDCDCEPGNANADATINILDITYMIAYLYKGGPAPTPYAVCSADPNCDCTVNILDITYLIAYLYKAGPPPCDCDTWVTNCGSPIYK